MGIPSINITGLLILQLINQNKQLNLKPLHVVHASYFLENKETSKSGNRSQANYSSNESFIRTKAWTASSEAPA